MNKSEIAAFLRANIEPLPHSDWGNRYRAAAHLKEGTFLPCVVFQSRRNYVDVALERLEELREHPDEYRSLFEIFVAWGLRVAAYEIDSVETSPFAWPLGTLRKIQGEHAMSWTVFVVEMTDGKRFSYGTGRSMEFFDLPNGYTSKDIKEVYSGMVHSDQEGTQPFTLGADDHINYLRERHYFSCYMRELDEQLPHK